LGEQMGDVVYHPAGHQLAVYGGGVVDLWDVRPAVLARPPVEHRNPLVVSDDGRYLAAYDARDNFVRVTHVTHVTQPTIELEHPQAAVPLAFVLPVFNTHRLATWCRDNQIHVWDVATKTDLMQVAHAVPPFRTLFSPDGKRLAAITYDQGRYEIRMWDLATATAVGTPIVYEPDETATRLGVTPRPPEIAFDAAGQQLRVAMGDEAFVRDAATLEPAGETIDLRPEGWTIERFWSPDGSRLATVNSAGRGSRLWLWDPTTGLTVGGAVELPFPLGRACFSGDGGTLAVVVGNDTVQFCDPSTGNLRGEPIIQKRGIIVQVQLNETGDRAALVWADGALDYSIQVWDVPTGTRLGEPYSFKFPIGRGYQIAFGDDSTLAIGDRETVKLWRYTGVAPASEPQFSQWLRVMTGKSRADDGTFGELSPDEWLAELRAFRQLQQAERDER
jgi:WD40 repeat protein